EKIENISAYDWLSNKVSKRTFDIIFRPLLYGKFGKFYKTIGMPWFWAKIQTRVSSRNYKFQEILCYPNGSFSKLISKLEKEIKKNDGKIYFDHKVTKIITKDNSIDSVNIIDNKSTKKNVKYDIVISTAPYQVLDKLIDLDQKIQNSMNKVEYMSAIVMILVLNNSLSEYYWLSIAENKFPFLGIIEHTNLIPKEKYGDKNIIYITNYVENDNNLLKYSYKELIDLYTPYLKKINKNFDKDWILEYRFNKINYAQPIIPVNYSKNIIPLSLPIKGLFSGNTAQIYPEDRGTNYAVALGNKITKLIIKN
ncbi:MAG: FAD-dependent oxidoreductase, partial [Chloroflexota bacterium]|nr:FAD-dependent oxidoreductase [Chloroflexota bacterium]